MSGCGPGAVGHYPRALERGLDGGRLPPGRRAWDACGTWGDFRRPKLCREGGDGATLPLAGKVAERLKATVC